MKKFFEEYGFTILASIVVILLITMTTPIGTVVKNNISNIIDSFSNKTLQRLDAIDNDRVSSGTVINIDDKEYTVIEQVKNEQYKVLTTDIIQKAFDDNRSNNYATSTIATYLDDDYYNSLPKSIKNAIVEISIQQKVSSTGYDNGRNNPIWTSETKNAGTHKVFIPSWNEVTKAYGTTSDKLKAYAPAGLTWLRDIYKDGVLVVHENSSLYGFFSYDYDVPIYHYYVHPAFVIDLSKVSYAVK